MSQFQIGPFILFLVITYLKQGFPSPGTGPRPVRNPTAQQEVGNRRVSGASSVAPHRSHYRLNHHHPCPPPPRLWKNCLPRNRSLMPKMLGTTDLKCYPILIVTVITVCIYCPYVIINFTKDLNNKLF